MKLKAWIFVLLIGSLLVLVACGSSTPATKAAKIQGDATAGKTKFSSTCVSCHGADGKGIQGLGKDMTSSAFIKSTSDDDLVTFITKGRPASDPANTTKVDMPPKGGNPAFAEKDLYDIVAFIRTISK